MRESFETSRTAIAEEKLVITSIKWQECAANNGTTKEKNLFQS